MLYKTHITTWYTVASTLFLTTGIYNPLIFLAVPLFALLADSDHNKGMVAQTLKLKFWFLWHRWILHSWFWLLILNIIFTTIFFWIIHLSWVDLSNFLDVWNITNLWSFFTFLNASTAIGVIIKICILILWLLISWWILYNILWFLLNKILGKTISNFLLNIISVILFFWTIFFLFYIYKEIPSPFINTFVWLYILLLSHLVWDYFTNTGFPFFYPFSKRRIKAPLTFSTWKSMEKLVFVILTIINIWLLVKITHSIDNWTIVYITKGILAISTILFWIIWLLLFKGDMNIFKQLKQIMKNMKGLVRTLLVMLWWIVIFSISIFWILYLYFAGYQSGSLAIILGIWWLIGLISLLVFLYKNIAKSYSYTYFISVSVLFLYITIYSIIGVMLLF